MKHTFLMIVLSCLGWLSAYALSSSNKIYQGHAIVPGELIVKLRPELSIARLKSLNLEGVNWLRSITTSYATYHLLKLDGSKSFEAHIKDLHESGNFEFVEPNYIYSIGSQSQGLPDDPKASLLWGLQNRGNNEPLRDGGTNSTEGKIGVDINALKAWEISKGERSVKIAIIDTGIDYNHSDLKRQMWVNKAEKNGQAGVDDDGNGYVDDIYGYDFASDDADPLDGHGHGTHCAGTIGATHSNQIGVAGVMAEVSLVAVKFLNDSGSGTTEAAIKSIDYATQLDVDIMSNSWGGGGFSQALQEAIERARDKGILFVAAAGNDRGDNDVNPHYPSNYKLSNVISVAAHNAQERLATFSNWGKTTVHLAAPGRNILSTIKENAYGVYSGTSMATPHVSGALGLLVAREGRMNFDVLKERLMATTVPVRSYRRLLISGGRLDAYNLLTDTRPVRVEPDPTHWKRVKLDSVFESVHPYPHNAKQEVTISRPGAKYLRVIIKKYDIERGYDFLEISDPNSNEVIEKMTGQGEKYATDYVEGDRLKLSFTSDYSMRAWGFVVEEYEYID